MAAAKSGKANASLSWRRTCVPRTLQDHTARPAVSPIAESIPGPAVRRLNRSSSAAGLMSLHMSITAAACSVKSGILVATLLRRLHPTSEGARAAASSARPSQRGKEVLMTNGSASLAHPAPENSARLTTLDPAAGYITIINNWFPSCQLVKP